MSSVQRQSSSGSDGSVVDDKKRKKMQSNRESARRSRMKKQKRVEELTVEISRLQISNGQIRQSIDAKDKAYSEVEAWNNVMRAQEKELTDRLRYLESIEQTFVEFSGGVFDEDINDMAEMHDSLLNPWQLPYSTQRFCSVVPSPNMSDDQTLHIAMYPWFAMGHLTPFLHISNKLAERGHKISLFLPLKTQSKLQHYNLHPHLITFIPINVPHVDGLPPGTETTADIPLSLGSLLATAMDLTRPQIEQSLLKLKPDFVFFDFSYWLPALLRELDNNIKSVCYWVITPAAMWYGVRSLGLPRKNQSDEADRSFSLRTHEARAFEAMMNMDYGREVTFSKRLLTTLSDCDAICFQTCREFAGPFCNYIELQMNKPVILAGPVMPDPPSSQLEEKWATWLGGFKPRTVIFCALGTEYILTKQQLQQLLLGFELTGLPFFAALKPPTGVESIESAVPEGFEERVKGKGVVYGGWVQQPLILKHPSIGCFVTHCGPGSLNEALLNECQLVFLPNIIDQVINARMMSGDLKVGVEVEKGDEDGLFTKEGVCKAVRAVMDEDSQVGKEVSTNHAKWREFISSKGLESSYIDGFVQKLHDLL